MLKHKLRYISIFLKVFFCKSQLEWGSSKLEVVRVTARTGGGKGGERHIQNVLKHRKEII